ncbi:hypothetical protein PL84_02540 [Vibrio anguillarum]|uniref:hypothetical protein n=1 Tax=Vibrio anguillarum TaxID=55601 RepID=UPI00097E3EB2|nr:hypothetical protein [Vibrio anguillarum]MBT2909455.1 hypothetical protein [Vibrio anguillarum]MBT2942519.1 hypothetical protein [Vibrio anguillarum]MBT2950657.1 hypothetical protein [Vibrio anguillarum]MBT2979599.1 hypothetical protein [Vibrio anguillarum]
MSKKDSQLRINAVISAIKAASEMDGLSAVFLSAFGETMGAQLHQAKALKEKLISTEDELEKFQVWRDIALLQATLSRYSDNRLGKLSEQGIDLNSLRKAYIPPDDLDERQRQFWQDKGKGFLNETLDSERVKKLVDISQKISELMRTNPDINAKIERLESELITPLAEQARGVISKIQEKGQDPALLSEFEMIRSAIESAHRTQIDPVLMASTGMLNHDAKEQLQVLQEQKKRIGTELMSGVYDALIEQSFVSEQEADTWASTQEISDSAVTRLRKSGYPESEVRRDMATYYRLTNGRLDSVRLITTGSKRASAIINTATIDIDHDFDRRTLFHEMSHLLEADESVKLANQCFIKNRASGSPKRLSELTNNRLYKSDEIAIPDNFYSPYVGKVYESGATEVASMGIQQFSSIESMFALYDSDEEMFTLMIGMMKGVDQTLIQRQKSQLSRQVLGAEFMSAMKAIVSKLSWQDGHRMPSDEAWQKALTGSGKVNAHNKKWGWKKILGGCELYPAKAPKQRKQIYGVSVTRSDGTHDRLFFRERLQAELFMYLHELSVRNVKPLAHSPFHLACSNQAPDWYQSGTDLPLI